MPCLVIKEDSFDLVHANGGCRCHTRCTDQQRTSWYLALISSAPLCMVASLETTSATHPSSSATMKLSMPTRPHPLVCSSMTLLHSALPMPPLSIPVWHSGMLLIATCKLLYCKTTLQAKLNNFNCFLLGWCSGVGMTSRLGAALRLRPLMVCLGLGVDPSACSHSSSTMGSPRTSLATASA